MANMSYCRFENTYRDLLDCADNMDNIQNKNEYNYMLRLVNVCREIIDTYEQHNMGEDWDGEEYNGEEDEDNDE